MIYFNILAEEWLAQNQQQMLNCPYQPGNLIISKNACLNRYMTGQKIKLNNFRFMNDDFFDYKFKRGLSLCRRCPIGEKIGRSQLMS